MFEVLRQWQGTAEILTEQVNHQIKELKLSVEFLTVRTVLDTPLVKTEWSIKNEPEYKQLSLFD